jgi:hypothetical protein
MSDVVDTDNEESQEGMINELKFIQALEALSFSIIGDDGSAISVILADLLQGPLTLNKAAEVCKRLSELEAHPNGREELVEYIARKVQPIDGFIEAVRMAPTHAVIGGVDFV